MKNKILVLALVSLLGLTACNAKVEEKKEEVKTEEKEMPKEETKQESKEENKEVAQEVVLTKEELAKYNGQNGEKAYVAVDGVIYDVTGLEAWKDGKHGDYQAGADLTEVIKNAPHGEKVLENLQVVGKLAE